MSAVPDSPAGSEISRARILLRRIRHRVTSTRVRTPVVWWRHRRLQASDVILASYPRSGSTWLRFILYEILTGQPSSFDRVNAALRGMSDYRHGSALLPGDGRLIGTHEPFRSEYTRAIYLVRDVRDVALSEFAFEANLGIGRPSLDEYLQEMLTGQKRHGSWHDHVESWIDSPLAASDNLLFLQYETLRRDSVDGLLELLEFLKVHRSREIVERAVANNTLQRMREKEDSLYRQENYSAVPRRPQRMARPGARFVRSGSVGGWHDSFSIEQLRLIENHTSHVLARLGYPVQAMSGSEVVHTA